MAIVIRYFKPTATGLGDGTSPTDAAQLVNGATWSSVITGFNFAGSDSLQCNIMPGTYAPAGTLLSASFANPPVVANPLIFHGADSSGVLLSPIQPAWRSTQPVTWDTNLPLFTPSVAALNVAAMIIRLIKISLSAVNISAISAASYLDWVSIVHTGSGSAVCLSNSVVRATNISCSMRGSTSYANVVNLSPSGSYVNVRIQGDPSASSGTRIGVVWSGTTSMRRGSGFTVFGNVGAGISDTSSNSAQALILNNCTIVNNGGNGISLGTTASQTLVNPMSSMLITGNTGWGIDAGTTNTPLVNSRLRDNGSGNLTNFANYPTLADTTDIYANTAAADAAEYVDATNFDFRVRLGSPIWGKGYGVSDQPLSYIRTQENFSGGVF